MSPPTHRLALLTFALAAVGGAGCVSPLARGQAEAERDIAAGKLCVRGFGFPVPWAYRSAELAKAQLGVECEAVAGCNVSNTLIDRTKGYNDRMLREIDHQFGPDALDRLDQIAKAEYDRDHGGDRHFPDATPHVTSPRP